MVYPEALSTMINCNSHKFDIGASVICGPNLVCCLFSYTRQAKMNLHFKIIENTFFKRILFCDT